VQHKQHLLCVSLIPIRCLTILSHNLTLTLIRLLMTIGLWNIGFEWSNNFEYLTVSQWQTHPLWNNMTTATYKMFNNKTASDRYLTIAWWEKKMHTNYLYDKLQNDTTAISISCYILEGLLVVAVRIVFSEEPRSYTIRTFVTFSLWTRLLVKIYINIRSRTIA